MKHKFLIVAPLVLALLLLSVSSAAAQSIPAECVPYAPSFVNEGQDFTVQVICWSTDPSNNFYGFQFGTAVTGNASTTATQYIPGDFVTDVAANQILEGHNSLDNYAVSRSNGAPVVGVADGQVVLGSVVYTADKGLTHNGSAEVTLDPMLLGDRRGAELDIYVQDSPYPVTIVDLYSLRLTINSDGSMHQLSGVQVAVDSVNPDSTTTNPNVPNVTLVYADKFAAPHTPTVSADMYGHLVCSGGTVNVGHSQTVAGLTLKAGDADNNASIGLADATLIGLAIGGAAPTSEENVNGDSVINIFDLIHVGRNYGASVSPCMVLYTQS